MAKDETQTVEGMEIVPEAVPVGTQRATSSKYRALLDQFVATGYRSGRVQSNANVSTLYQQLTKAIKNDPEAYAGIKASKREGHLFLINENVEAA